MGIDQYVFSPIRLNGSMIIGRVVLAFINAKDAVILTIMTIRGRCKMKEWALGFLICLIVMKIVKLSLKGWLVFLYFGVVAYFIGQVALEILTRFIK